MSKDGPIYFWRESEEPYGFLCQWYESAFDHEGITYLTAEMWMMIQKAKLFGDEQIVDQMLKTKDPRKHKGLGQKVKGFTNEAWDKHKDRIVEEGNWLKFTKNNKNPELKQKLLATGDRSLIEASPYDRVWGIGFTAANAEANKLAWGENRLGLALETVRDRIRAEDRKKE